MKNAFRLAAAVFAAALATSGSAFAAGPVMKPTPTPSPAATVPPPSPWTAPAPAATPMATETAATGGIMGPAHMEAVTYRPEGKSIGIGAGWTFPTALGTPNTVSARIRMEDGFTIEPGIQVDANIGSSKVSGGGASVKGSSSQINLIVGAALRKPIMGRNQVDVVGILTPGIMITSGSVKPAGGTETDTTGFGIGTGWGLGVEYWPKTHWSISFNALNPLLNIGTTSVKDKGAGTTTSTTNFFLGADFNPSVQLMTHLYY